MGKMSRCKVGMLTLNMIPKHIRASHVSGATGKELNCQCRWPERHGFDPCVRKIPWRRAWQPTAIYIFFNRGFPDVSVKNLPAMKETCIWYLSQEDPLVKGMATHSSILAWRIPWTEEPGGLQSTGSQSRTQLSDWAHNCCWTVLLDINFWTLINYECIFLASLWILCALRLCGFLEKESRGMRLIGTSCDFLSGEWPHCSGVLVANAQHGDAALKPSPWPFPVVLMARH